jgi:glutathione reductase (NADPH)
VITGDVRVDWPAAVDRAQRIVHHCGDPKPDELRAKGAHLVFGEGRFLDPHTIVVGDERLRGDQILIATGAHSARPAIEGLEHALTHVELLQLRTLPSSMVVIGGGVIAMEFAYMFARLGTRVTVLELAERILANLDGELRAAISAQAATLGIAIRTGVGVTSISREAGGLLVIGEGTGGAVNVTSDIVLLAAGQVPTVAGLGLDEAGVTYVS